MEYTRPTTQEEMYRVLQEIFYYYRIRREGFAGVELQPLELERLSYTPKTEQELLLEAQTSLASKHTQFSNEYVSGLNEKLALVESELSALPNDKQTRIDKVNSDFEASERKLSVAISKNGLGGSSIAVDKLAQMELEKNNILSEIELDYQTKLATLTAEKQTLIQKLNGAEDYCNDIISKENVAKRNELLAEQEKVQREVFKYNNGLDEKEQRYANDILKTNANLELRFLEIRAGEYTKDQLVEMGYYEDVIDVVCAYYDTLPALTAAQQIMRDTKIIEYLDHYYDNVIFMYQQRAT